jgi:hypothetical protein
MKRPTKTRPKSELEYFFWYCRAAAMLVDQLPSNPATRACVLNAVRKATDCYEGVRGVQYATPGALGVRATSDKPWHKLHLTREHVVPLSIIRERVVRGLNASRKDAPGPLALGDDLADELTPPVARQFEAYPRAWIVGLVVREMTVMAWITAEEEERFDQKERHGGISLRKRMPLDWNVGDDPLARYTACGLKLTRLAQLA